MMEIVNKNIDELIPYAMNQKEHPQEQIDKIASSLNQFGFKQPIVIDSNNEIIVGHGRFEGAKKLNLKEVPCLVADDLSDAQIKAYRLADNKLNESEWNEDFVNLELQVLDEMNFDYSDLMDFNFDDEEEDFEPDLKEQNYQEKIEIIVECEDEQQQEHIYNDLMEKGYKCRVQSL